MRLLGTAITARRVTMMCAIVWVATLLLWFAWRIAFPLELEWMEGGILHEASRIQQGEPIYAEPSTAFVPFLYTPLYPAVVAVLGFVFPLGFVLGRAVSVAACVAIGLATWRVLAREGKPPAHRLAGVGLIASGYVFTFRWLDLARPDTLAMALALWGLVLLREAWGHPRKAIASGLLLALAFWTKQTSVLFVGGAFVGGLLVAPRQLPWCMGACAAVGLGGLWLGQELTDGWLWTYIYELHQSHAFNDERFTSKTWKMFVHAAPFCVLLVLGLVARALAPWAMASRKLAPQKPLRPRLQAFRGTAYWGVMALVGLLASALGYSTQWAEPNAFIPGVVLGAIALMVAVPTRGRSETLALLCVSAQLVMSFVVEPIFHPIQQQGLSALGESYRLMDWGRTVPSRAQWERAAALREQLEQADGEVLALHRPWWSVLAGGEGHVGAMGLKDIGGKAARPLVQALRTDVAKRRYRQIWLEGEPPLWLKPALREYHVTQRLHGEDRVLPLSGWMAPAGVVTPYRDDQVRWEPITPRLPEKGVRVVADFEDGSLQGFTGEGGAFGRRPKTSITTGDLPAPAAIGGEFFLSSGGAGLASTGSARSAIFDLVGHRALELHLGTGGRTEGLSAQVCDANSSDCLPLELPEHHHTLVPQRWDIPKEWRTRAVYLRLEDKAQDGVLYLDDVWLLPE